MAETYAEKVDRILRDHQGYNGDGQGGQGALPTGDRGTARKPISTRDLRQVLKESDGAMNLGEANRYTDERASELQAGMDGQAAELQAGIDSANAHTDDRADALQQDIDAVRDIAFDQLKIYPNTAAGIAATIVGQEFSVQSSDPNIALRIYRHTAGGVATLIATTPSVTALADKASLDALAKAVGATYGVASAAGLAALTPATGETAITADTGFIHRWNGSAWVDRGESPLAGKADVQRVDALAQETSGMTPLSDYGERILPQDIAATGLGATLTDSAGNLTWMQVDPTTGGMTEDVYAYMRDTVAPELEVQNPAASGMAATVTDEDGNLSWLQVDPETGGMTPEVRDYLSDTLVVTPANSLRMWDAFRLHPDGPFPAGGEKAVTGEEWGVRRTSSTWSIIDNGAYRSNGTSYLSCDMRLPVTRMGASFRLALLSGGNPDGRATMALISWGDGGVTAEGLGRSSLVHLALSRGGMFLQYRQIEDGPLLTATSWATPLLVADGVTQHVVEWRYDHASGLVSITHPSGQVYEWTDVARVLPDITARSDITWACWEPYWQQSPENHYGDIDILLDHVWAESDLGIQNLGFPERI